MRCVLGAVLLLACSSSGPGGAGTGGSGPLGTGGQGAGGQGQSDESHPADAGQPPAGRKRVFVTSSRYPGDLKTAGGAADGLGGGDKLCQVAADAATLGGSWKAWLSASTPGGAATNAVDRIAEVGPWYSLQGFVLFNNKANLMTAPLDPIRVDENHRLVLENREVWTGTNQGGRSSGLDCGQWTVEVSPQSGTVGDAGAGDGKWTDSPASFCNLARRLYCLEQ